LRIDTPAMVAGSVAACLMFSQTHQSGAGKFPMLSFHLYHSFSCCQGLRIDTLEMAAVAIAV